MPSYDPTNSTKLRNALSSQMYKRWMRILSKLVILRNIRVFDSIGSTRIDGFTVELPESFFGGPTDPLLKSDLENLLNQGIVSEQDVNNFIAGVRSDFEKEGNRQRGILGLGREVTTVDVIKNALELHSDEYLLANPALFIMSPSAKKMEVFNKYMERNLQDYILDHELTDEQELRIRYEQINQEAIDEKMWTDEFVEKAYEKGVYAAWLEMQQSGAVPESFFGGLDKLIAGGVVLGLLSRRQKDSLDSLRKSTRSELSTVVNGARNDISRIVSEGLRTGMSSAEIHRSISYLLTHRGKSNTLVDSIGRRYSVIDISRQLARTEISRIVNEAALDTYEMFGVTEVTADVEMIFTTQGDRLVCPICESFSGAAYKITDARNVIPMHRNCRCFWVARMKRNK